MELVERQLRRTARELPGPVTLTLQQSYDLDVSGFCVLPRECMPFSTFTIVHHYLICTDTARHGNRSQPHTGRCHRCTER